MYRPNHFQLNEHLAQLEFINQNGFGSLITCFNGKIQVNQLPFILDQSGKYLMAHCAKANLHWQQLEQATDLRVCFDGPNAYISPSWYSDPKKNVPTWNFVSLQVRGKAALMNQSELIELLDQLSQKHEAQFESPWTIDKLSEEQLQRMSKAIVGFKISIDEIEGKAKLSQNKSKEEKQNLMNGLSEQKDPGSQQILKWMKDK
jgi:transcriptional regulator